MDNGIGLGELLAVMNSRDNDGFDGGSWMWVIFLFFIFAIFFAGGDGLFGRGGGPATTAFTGTEFTLSNIERQVQGVQQGICDSTYALNTSILNNKYELGQDLCQGFNSVNGNISQLGYQMQNCCCETNRNIDAVRYENAKNTCDIITAGQANTQRIIDIMTQDKIEALRTELQSAQLALQNNAQTQTLINELRPCAIPAYLTCSPYTALGYGNSGCGCGC